MIEVSEAGVLECVRLLQLLLPGQGEEALVRGVGGAERFPGVRPQELETFV